MKSILLVLIVLITDTLFAQKKIEITVTNTGGSISLAATLDGTPYTNTEIDFKKDDKIILKSASNLDGFKVQLFNNDAAPMKIMEDFNFPLGINSFEFTQDDQQFSYSSAPVLKTAQYTNDIKVLVTEIATPANAKSIILKIKKTGTKKTDKNDATIQQALIKYVQNEIDKNGYNYVNGQNIIFDSRGIIHIYLDEDLHPIYSYFPTVAKSGYDNFQFHIVSKNSLKGTSFVIESTGEFNDTPIATDIDQGAKSESGNKNPPKYKFNEYSSAIFGPFTGTFPFTINKTNPDKSPLSLEKEVKLLRTSRVSLNTGVIGTFLKDPENISTFVKPNGDTTLISDNPTTRGFLGLVLTFHIKPRNLNIKPRDMYERLGISVGTNINAASFNNFFAGLNIELTNGLFINGGLHYGQVNYVADYKKFKYGEDKFSGTLEVRKKWMIAPYLAINIDAGLFAKVFKNILSPSPSTVTEN